MRIAVTGANGHLGIRLVRHLLSAEFSSDDEQIEISAIVRSDSARSKLTGLYPNLDVHVVSYTDIAGLGVALSGCQVVVHLVGIIKESRNSSFQQAHEASCEALLSAAVTSGGGSGQGALYSVEGALQCIVGAGLSSDGTSSVGLSEAGLLPGRLRRLGSACRVGHRIGQMGGRQSIRGFPWHPQG